MEKEMSIMIEKINQTERSTRYAIKINDNNIDYFAIDHLEKTIVEGLIGPLRILFNIINGGYQEYCNLLGEYGVDYPKDKKSIYNLKKGEDQYYFINDCRIEINSTHWHGLKSDYNLLQLGNVYRTRVEAEKILDKKLATQRIVKRIAELNDGWEPNWNDDCESKFHFGYDHKNNNIEVCYSWTLQRRNNNEYIDNIDHANIIANEMEKDLKLMLGVDE